MTERYAVDALVASLPRLSPGPELEAATLTAILEEVALEHSPLVRALRVGNISPPPAVERATLAAILGIVRGEPETLEYDSDSVLLLTPPTVSLAAMSRDEMRDAGKVRRSDQDFGYTLRYISDEGFLRVFIHAEREGFTKADQFQVTFEFENGETISSTVEYPRHSYSGANFGELGGLEVDDIVSVTIKNNK